jgi:ubiquinone/menaquinone biosynthesis C-methylase UbiE
MSIKKIIKSLLFLHEYEPYKQMGFTHYQPPAADMLQLRKILVDEFFSKFPEPFPVHDRAEVENGFSWMDDHLNLRLKNFREDFVPFLNSVMNLHGKNVVDVGCGTGSSLVALAEAGANVYGIDIDEPSLKVARKRCEIYKTSVDISLTTATDLGRFKTDVKFDYIIFNASLEHMFLQERLTSMKAAWERLSPGGCMAIIECPNRLWYFDVHTAQLPFFEWLPHDLALMYTRFSPRKYINHLYSFPLDEKTMEQFTRIGRGMSYHEIDLAIKRVNELNIAGNLGDFQYKHRNWLDKYRLRKRTDYVYQNLLSDRSGFNLNKAFCDRWLNLVIKK